MKTPASIEPLEARIAPAAFLTYTDADGDLVKITASKGPLDADDLTFVSGGASPSLALLTLTGPSFQGASITFTVTAKGSGDGRVQVAEINAAGVDLKSVTIKGDLQKITAGDGVEETPGLGLLSVGRLGPLAYGGVAGSLLYNDARSVVVGALGTLKIGADFNGGRLEVDGGIGSITIGGSLFASPTQPGGRVFPAHITATGKIGNVAIGGDLMGGDGEENGMLSAGGALGNVKIGGDLLGGAGKQSGYLHGATIGNISIGRDLQGGAGEESGRIFSEGRVGNITIGRNMVGDGGQSSATIQASTMGDIVVHGYLKGGSGLYTGRLNGSMRNLTIDGSLYGGTNTFGASIEGGTVGNIKIGGSIFGQDGRFGGSIRFGTIGNLSIGGGVIGGTQSDSANILVGSIGNLTIGGDLKGGTGYFSGYIFIQVKAGNVKIGGDLLGGAGTKSGYLYGANIGNVSIAGNLVGGSTTGNASLEDSGVISSEGRIASVTIGKSLIAGTDTSTGTLERSGAIVAGSLGPVKIGVGIAGNATNAALILAKGLAVKPATGFDSAIARLTVKGDVQFARILAGFDGEQAQANADAAIGAVSVGGDWVASSLVAGARDTGAAGFGFGDTRQTVGNTGLIARIASIAIKGIVQGTAGGGDHFGFVAEHIAKLTIGGKPIALTAGPSNDNALIPTTGDVHLLEVAAAPV